MRNGEAIRELGRRVYFAVPPAARRALLGPPRVVTQALQGLRVGVWRMGGPVGEDGARLDVVYAGSPELRHYARWLLFPDGAEEKALGRHWVSTLPALLRTQAEPPALLVHQMRTWVHRLLRPRGLFYPLWIFGLVDPQRYAQHDSVVYDRKRIRRSGYSYRVSNSLEDFRHFYDELYLPFSRAHYGDSAEIRPFRKAIKKFRHWDLVLVEKNGETVAGGQIVYTPAAPQVALTGMKEDSREMVKDGAIAAIYYFMVEHLRERGHPVVDFGGVRPALNDGLFRFKRQRGFRAHQFADNGYALIPLLRTEGLERFLCRTPWVRVDRGKLVGTVFVAGDGSAEPGPAELVHRYLVRGLDRLDVYRLGRDAAAEPAEVPPQLAKRLRVLPAARVLGGPPGTRADAVARRARPALAAIGAPAPRRTAPAWKLVREAVGGPREVAGKLRRLFRTLRLWTGGREIERRLATLERRGLLRQRPTRLQLVFGGLDMLRFVIEPAARDYYAQQGISFGFHQLLRVLDDPVSMIDPTGFLSDRDTIVGHVMQVVHLNPVYDLQLIQMFDDGLEDFERQVEAMVAKTHPRARTIAAIVEDPDYHARLLDYVRRYRTDPNTPPPVREQHPSLRDEPHFAAAERTFATLPGFIAYCNKLPRDACTLLRRLRTTQEFPLELADDASGPVAS